MSEFIVNVYEDEVKTGTELAELMACDDTSCFTNCTSSCCFCQTD